MNAHIKNTIATVSIYNEKKIYAPSGLRGQKFFHETDRLFGKNSSNRYFSGQYPLEKKSPTHTNCNVITTICTDILTRKIDLQSFFQ